MAPAPLVTIALPVFNGGQSIAAVADSVLAQDHPNLELLISDNASTDDTESVCRELARADSRVRYERQPRNIGLINNFEWTKSNCRGQYLRWIGDNDDIKPNYISRCLSVFAEDPRLILVTTQIEYATSEGDLESMPFDASALRSEDPVDRLAQMLDLLTRTYLLLDPLYGMTRVDAVREVTHDRMIRGDEVYAAKLALAGPWGHVPEILARRHWGLTKAAHAAQLLEVPRWQARLPYLIQLRRLLDSVGEADLNPAQRRRARGLVVRLYFQRHRAVLQRAVRKARRHPTIPAQ